MLAFGVNLKMNAIYNVVLSFCFVSSVSLVRDNLSKTTSNQLNRSFVIDYDKNCFLKDNKPFRYISGSIHYFKVPRVYWNDRLQKAKALGLNAIQTYVAWNVHEPYPGKYDFEGNNDLIHFIKLAQKNDLFVILRPGPYIDAEWEFGGFPWWLAKHRTLSRSSRDVLYMLSVHSWFAQLLPKLKPLLYKNSGPIIAIQVENEYGNYFSCDHNYLEELRYIYDKYLGKKSVVLFTTDGYTKRHLKCGTLPSLYASIDFGTEITAEEAFKKQRVIQPHGPLVNSEYYTGWLDYWGYPHERRNSLVIAKQLDSILALNASVNLYMFHGGTNFGFMNGIDIDRHGNASICTTSYDYDAPLTEAGDTNKKYFAIREVIQKYTSTPLKPVPKSPPKVSYGKINFSMSMNLSEFIQNFYPIGATFRSAKPLSMEEMNQGYGFIVYTAEFPSNIQNSYVTLSISEVHDRSVIFVDGVRLTAVARGEVKINIPPGKLLSILVENQGRACFGSGTIKYLPDPKGILSDVKINSMIVTNWSMYVLDNAKLLSANNLNHQTNEVIAKKNKETRVPKRSKMFFFSSFQLKNISDTFIKLTGWTKGQVIINSFNVGRYWQTKGPQQTLYVPKSALKVGTNRLLIFELDEPPCYDGKMEECFAEFVNEPILL